MPDLISFAYLLLVCGLLPLAALLSKRKLDRGLRPPRLAIYTEVVVLQLILLAISVAAAAFVRVPLPRGIPGAADLLLGAALLGIALGAMAIGWRFAGPDARERLLLLLPATRTERLAWIGVSSVAGIAEEVVYRAVLPAILFRMTGELWLAILLSAGVFALAHLIQGWTSALLVGVFALLFHLLVWVTGGLWVAIAVHILYDVVAGFTLGKIIAPHPEVADAQV